MSALIGMDMNTLWRRPCLDDLAGCLPKSGWRACFFLGVLSVGLLLSVGCFAWHLAAKRDGGADPWLCHYQGEAYSLGSVIEMVNDVAKACRLVDGVPVWDR